MATKVTSHVLSNDALAKERNLLINGGMNVWQRSTSVTGITGGTEYRTVDRWELDIVNSFGTGAGTYTMAQSTDVPSAQGFAYSTRIDMTATGDQVTGQGNNPNKNLVKLQQKIEGQNVQHLLKGTSDAKALTLSFWVKSNKTSNFVVQFTDPTNSRNISREYTINTTNTWEKKTILIPGDTTGTIDNDNTSGFTVEFWLFAGLGYLTGTLATSWGANAEDTWAAGMLGSLASTDDDWSITGVQLEVGEAATPFEFEPYETVLRKCHRYFVQDVFAYAGTMGGGSANIPLSIIQFPVRMCQAPAVSWISGGTVSDGQYDSTISSQNSTQSSNPFSCRVLFNRDTSGTPSVVGRGCDIRGVTMKYDAEL